MSHDKKKQSTGSWKKNKQKHQNLPKGLKEKKRLSLSWFSLGKKKKK